MLKLPGNLSAEEFLQSCWQKKPLFMPRALDRVHPAVTRNELGWLATLEDVESRVVFTERHATRTSYRAESGPFAADDLQALPKRDWTLLVHDVEKHLPAMRALFRHVPFIPDWRIDDLMVSFAAPGGGVGPHRDNYDVFLCQGIGTRHWRITTATIGDDDVASSDLALVVEFDGEELHDAAAGDVLYLPPGVAHWGTATRACITYSIGMRAPQVSDLMLSIAGTTEGKDAFYGDPDLQVAEARAGYLSPAAARRARNLLGMSEQDAHGLSIILGRFVTQTKANVAPEHVEDDVAREVIRNLASLHQLRLHGMTRIAFDDDNIYVNGASRPLNPETTALVAGICAARGLDRDTLLSLRDSCRTLELMEWLLISGAFYLPENF